MKSLIDSIYPHEHMDIPNSRLPRRAIALPFLLYTLFAFVTILLEVPTVRLFENAICNRYHGKATEETMCKTATIQRKLAYVVGWKTSLDSLAGLITAFFYGSIADRRGRQTVLFLAGLGYLLMLIALISICMYHTSLELRSFPFSKSRG
jgi:MFS family permease